MRPKNLIKEEAIREAALRIISEEGLENLSMQKLAKAANISARTIYLKYENKDDLLIKLFIDVVLERYESATLEHFSETMDFSLGVKKIWLNAFRYFKKNRHAFALLQYGKFSPLLNRAFVERNINEGQFFGPIHRFIKHHQSKDAIADFPLEIHRALLFAPLLDLVHEYFEYKQRPVQIITEKIVLDACEAVIRGMLL